MTSPITLIFKKHRSASSLHVYVFPMDSPLLALLWFHPVCELGLTLVSGTELRNHMVFKHCLVGARGDSPT